MSTLNKQSIREEFDKIKASFDEQVRTKKVSAEVAVLFNALIMLFNIVLSIFLEKQTKKTSRNSGLPSSQTGKDTTSPPDPKTNSKGHSEKRTTAGNTRTVETVERITVSACNRCDCDLSAIPASHIERRTKIDIIFEKTVAHVDAEVKECPKCQETVKGAFPRDMSGPLQYGNGIKAYVVQLLVTQMLSLKRAVSLLTAMIGQVLSETTLLNFVMRVHEALALWEEEAQKQLLQSSCLHTDETSCRVNKKNHWIHVYSSGDITLKYLHAKRGKQAMEEIGLIPKYGGVIVHDCWSSYLSYTHCTHALCGSHLLRELTFAIDAHGYRWAKQMKRLLQRTCHWVSQAESKSLSPSDYSRIQRLYRVILSRGENEMPPVLSKPYGRRGRVAQSDAHNLLDRLKKYEQEVLLFAKITEVPFTNNRAERDLRMGKVKQKVSGCFRSEEFAKAYCRISSYLQTMQNRGVNPLVAISMILN